MADTFFVLHSNTAYGVFFHRVKSVFVKIKKRELRTIDERVSNGALLPFVAKHMKKGTVNLF